MSTTPPHTATQPVFRGITPRPSLRRNTTQLQSSELSDNAMEGEKSKTCWPTVWEKTVSCSKCHLHIPFLVKIAYYLTTVLALSTVHDYVDLPHVAGVTGKHTILNQVFVKKGWGFTLGVFIPYGCFSLLLRPKLIHCVKKLIIRTAGTTVIFFLWCQAVFPAIDNFTATCIGRNETLSLSKAECLSAEGREYFSFDISGHSFLMIYCVLVMMEESKEILYFLWLGRRLHGDGAHDRTENNITTTTTTAWPDLTEKQVTSLKRWFPKISPFVAFTFVSMCVLALLWDFMILVTTLYYHSFAEKVIGTVLALCSWGFLYRLAFPWIFSFKMLRS